MPMQQRVGGRMGGRARQGAHRRFAFESAAKAEGFDGFGRVELQLHRPRTQFISRIALRQALEPQKPVHEL